MEEEYKKYYVVKDLEEDSYVSYFKWNYYEHTTKIYKAKLFDTIEEALCKAKDARLGHIRIDIIRVLEDIDEDNFFKGGLNETTK